MRAIVCVCVANWHLRKHERTPSDTDNHCSKARHRAAIFVLMTSLPSLLVPVFMCWLGYSIEPASDLQGCVYVCVCVGGGGELNQDTVLFCSSQCSGKRSYKTVCQPVFSLSSLKSTCFLSVCLSQSLSLSLQPCILLHWLTSLPDSQAHCFTQCISAPHPNNQLSYLDTVSLQHTDLRFLFAREQSVQCID